MNKDQTDDFARKPLHQKFQTVQCEVSIQPALASYSLLAGPMGLCQCAADENMNFLYYPSSHLSSSSSNEYNICPCDFLFLCIIMWPGLSIIFILYLLITLVYSSPLLVNEAQVQKLGTYDPVDEIFKRATTRTKATTVTQSINNWIEDIDTVNQFLNVALALPIGGPLKAGASKALAFAQDEPVNVEFLKAIPGIDTAGLSAATTLEQVFGGVLDQLGNVVDNPLSLPVAVNAVARINVNRLVSLTVQNRKSSNLQKK